jgi:DNA-binding NtrC family response regulator
LAFIECLVASAVRRKPQVRIAEAQRVNEEMLPAEQPVILLGESPVIDALRADIQSAARTHAKVLITGETGAGKEIVARLIHTQSARSRQPFMAVNCSGIPETLLASELFGHARGSFTGAYRDKVGLIRQADRGTLFLDELGEMSLAMQATLLRFSETGEVQTVGVDTPAGRADVRLITATNRDLRAQIAAGEFREDLYYRLNVIHIRIPPLRERGRDVLLLFRHFLRRASEAHHLPPPDLTPDAEEVVLSYGWPGNVRELRNVTERIAIRDSSRPITPADLPNEIRAGERVAAVVPGPAAAVSSVEQPQTQHIAQHLWDKLMTGADFWEVVQKPFRAHEVTRAELAALIDRGLQETRGSYRALVRLFNLPPDDYKRFHAFLYQQNCNLPVGPYRTAEASRTKRGVPAGLAS